MDDNSYQDAQSPTRLQFGMRGMFVSVTVIALVVAAVVSIRRFVANEKGPRRPFVASLWKQAAPTHPCQRTIRSEMVDDLLNKYDFMGWTRTQVAGLLGSPSPPWSGFEQWDMYYVLGLERAGSYALDDEALGFNFDSADRVVKFGTSVN